MPLRVKRSPRMLPGASARAASPAAPPGCEQTCHGNARQNVPDTVQTHQLRLEARAVHGETGGLGGVFEVGGAHIGAFGEAERDRPPG